MENLAKYQTILSAADAMEVGMPLRVVSLDNSVDGLFRTIIQIPAYMYDGTSKPKRWWRLRSQQHVMQIY